MSRPCLRRLLLRRLDQRRGEVDPRTSAPRRAARLARSPVPQATSSHCSPLRRTRPTTASWTSAIVSATCSNGALPQTNECRSFSSSNAICLPPCPSDRGSMSFDGIGTWKPAGRYASGSETYEIFRLDALQDRWDVARLPYSLRVLLENALRAGSDHDAEAIAGWVAAEEPSREISFRPSRVIHQDFTGVPAIVDLAAMRNAMQDLGGDPARDQPGDPRRARDRPLGAGGRVRDAARLRPQRRARVRAEPRALRLPPLGPGRVRRTEGRPARHRHRPPGQPRVPRARGRGARRAGVPRHARRHRLAHDDGQRARRARLGRRRDRGRGGDARRGALDARPAGGRLPADRRAARGRDRDRPRPDRDRDPPLDRRGREVRRVLRARARRPLARRPGDDREHVAGVRRDLRLLPGGRRDAPVPAPDRPAGRAGRAGRGLLQGEHALARGRRPPDLLPGGRARPRHRRAEPRRAAPPAGPRAAAQAKEAFLHELPSFGVDYGNAKDEAVAESFPASDPPAHVEPGHEEPCRLAGPRGRASPSPSPAPPTSRSATSSSSSSTAAS